MSMEKFQEVLAQAGENFLKWLPGAAWKLGQIVLTLALALIIYRLTEKAISGFIRRLDDNQSIPTSQRKLKTLRSLTLLILRISIVFFAVVAVFNVLELTGVLTSLVATAGVGGLLIAFGAQSMVKDFIAGLMLTMGDQITLGDYVEISGISGTVEGLTLRTVQIRGFRGELHTLPAGSITMVTNYSRGDTLAVVDMRVPFDTTISRAVKLLEEEAALWAKKRSDLVKGEPQVLGVIEFTDGGMTLRTVCKVVGLKHWEAEREMRVAFKQRLEQEGIVISYPHLVVVSEDKE